MVVASQWRTSGLGDIIAGRRRPTWRPTNLESVEVGGTDLMGVEPGDIIPGRGRLIWRSTDLERVELGDIIPGRGPLHPSRRA
ncbi:hypothetical protein U1Q18_047356 [Sarracenia purpurea var. burkii]